MKLASLVATGLTTAALGGFLALSAPTVEAARPAGPDMFDLDPVHSSVNFRVMHKGTSWATGRFNKLSGELAWAPESLEDCSVTFEIDPSSVDTNDEARDKHLRGPDFFNVKQFPKLTFTSTGFAADRDGGYDVTGEIAWMGKKLPVTADLEYVGSGGGNGRPEIGGWSAEFVLTRSDFGVDYGVGSGTLGDDVHVRIDVEAYKR
ncbi:MAG: YceI family protein [Planctomycetota bacterium]|jgi:polyisoprenoid-binding protein YceI